MNFLLDTNVISEPVKPRPNENVVRWLTNTDEDRLYLSVVTFLEIRQGTEFVPTGARRDGLERWITHDLRSRFERRIVGIDDHLAESCGALLTQSHQLGWNLSVLDAFLAVTARSRSYTFVTRNTRHFERLGINLLNPWS